MNKYIYAFQPNQLVDAARKAGEAIMAIYNSAGETEIQRKDDDSPLTRADIAAHKIIEETLCCFEPRIPILSEEGAQTAYAERCQWPAFWLVDPLDGTKEFINRNGEFTVNIALIIETRPVMGVVYAPAIDELYFGDAIEEVAWMQSGNNPKQPIISRQALPEENGGRFDAVGSRSHATEQDRRVAGRLGVKDVIPKGSSLKFCMLAKGAADVYFRGGPTSEWDIGAGEAVLMAAGGRVLTATGPLHYNKPQVINPGFIALGAAVPPTAPGQYFLDED